MTIKTTDPDATVETVRHALAAHAGELAAFLAPLVVNLGAREEWSLDDNFAVSEGLADLVGTLGLPPVGGNDPDALAFYRAAADAAGIEHDGDDESEA